MGLVLRFVKDQFVQFQVKMGDINHDDDMNIEMWKIKRMIKSLEAARGNGTNMMSIIMPPRDQVKSLVLPR
ncbi:unnamed protein product [Microthlaspi erraticum]|uniref:eRF1/Pelota-like N-terminal domain-containing protein n=1 Tax=Microthlaspi erraticum TaxID=1685480 RepID=A0A6D2J6S0_9BRAS|nr:unnamed protein product [Microthlaspi erraticum]CAA7035476.1 unnamed protein product [Microthlaspi erraticum]